MGGESEKKTSLVAPARTGLLVAAATFASGILAGTVVDRALVGGPAWRALGAEAWEEFSRRADLGPGLVAYPVEAIGTTLLLIAAVVSSRFDHNGKRAVTLSLAVAVALSLLGLLITLKAAPTVLSLRATEPAASVQQAFNDFFFWGLYMRGAVDVLTFVAVVWALYRLSGSSAR
jgi:hypothetical protein